MEYGSQMCRNYFKISFSTAHHLQPFKKGFYKDFKGFY